MNAANMTYTKADIELLKKGVRTDIYRSGADTILKVLKTDSPLALAIYRLENELEITGESSIKGVRKAIGKEMVDDRQAILLEYVEGSTWREQLETGNWNVGTFLSRALVATELLAEIHAAGFIHQEIIPDHIITEKASDRVIFIGFGGAIKKDNLNPVDQQEVSQFQQDRLAYLSPEQTGRTQQKIGFTTDLYSLGAVFYEMLTGKPLFDLEDPLEMIHAHIAKAPTPPHEIRTDLPLPLSAMILRLLDKNPEERFASAEELATTLKGFLKQWEAKGELEQVGQNGVDGKPMAKTPEQLYGREKEISELHEVYQKVEAGAVAFTLISGPSGVSKSSLIRSLRKKVRDTSGIFIEGKFDPYQTEIPYFTLVQGLKQMVAFLLTKNEEELDYWKKRLIHALGNLGRVMTDMVPELTLIIGEQPELPKLEGQESQNRFILAVQNFIGAIAAREHPLVMVADDLQWADTDSLILLERLEKDSRISHFMLIAAFRDETISVHEPVHIKIEEWKKGSEHLHEIKLKNLERPLVKGYVKDTFVSEIENEEGLVELVFNKTRGNPLYLQLMVNALINEKIVHFNEEKNLWAWNESSINQLNLSGSLLDLLTARFKYLTSETQLLLSTAACAGNRFVAEMIQEVLGFNDDAFHQQLTEAIMGGMVILGEGASVDDQTQYSFAHTRIRKIAYDRLSDQEKKQRHLQLGQMLYDNASPAERSAQIFDILLQLNQGKELITDKAFRTEIAGMNLEAGKKARLSAAFGLAFNYMSEGIEFLTKSGWEEQYALALELHTQAVDLAALNGDYDTMEALTELVNRNARNQLDKEDITQTTIYALIAQKRVEEAVDVGLAYLEPLGVKFPSKPGQLHIIKEILNLKLKLMGKKTDQLINLPKLEDEKILSILRILAETTVAVYFASPNLTPLIIAKAVKLSLKHGIAPENSFAFGTYGFILSGALRDYKKGFEFGELSVEILENANREDLYVRQKFIHNVFTRQFIEPTREIIEVMDETYQKGLELGDFEYAAYAAGSWAYFSFYLGIDLAHIEEKLWDYMESVAQMNQPTTLPRIGVYQQAVLNLQGKSDDPLRIKGEAYDEDVVVPIQLKDNIGIALHNYYFLKTFLGYLHGDQEMAEQNAAETAKYEEAAMTSYFVPMFDYLRSLVYLSSPNAKSNLSKVNKLLKKMKKYALAGPYNYLHQYTLVRAEAARVAGKNDEARTYYEDAISQAQEVGNLLDEALSWERGGVFYMEDNRSSSAGIYLRKAYDLYEKWGAVSKTRQMESLYAMQLGLHERNGGKKDASGFVAAEQLDFLSLVKTLQTLSTEIELTRLLEKMMGIVIENAGADRGLLLLESEKGWEITAEKDVNNPEHSGNEIRSLTESDKQHIVPAGIIHFAVRTQEVLVINDVHNDERFADLDYFKSRPAKAVMVVPLVKQNRLIGVVYLENSLSAGTFTPRILSGMNLLSGQLAISLENARLYDNLEQKVKERTAEVVKQKGEIEEQANELLEKNEKLLELGEFKENMTSMIVHDLKNPLNSILNVSASVSPIEQNKMMRNSGQMMLNMVLNILDVNKYENSQMALSLGSRNVYALASSAIAQVEFLAERKQVELMNLVDEGAEIYADHEIIERIFVNLLTNAIKYSPVKGKIYLSAEDDGEFIKLSVRDEGQGVKQEDQKKIFAKFSQVAGRKSGTVRSTGLGLAFCMLAVESHSGELGVESQWGDGAKFWFTIRKGGNSAFVGVTGDAVRKSQDQELKLSASDKFFIREVAAQMDGIPVYKVTRLRQILGQLEPQEKSSAEKWKTAIQLTISIGDQKYYEHLISLVLND